MEVSKRVRVLLAVGFCVAVLGVPMVATNTRELWQPAASAQAPAAVLAKAPDQTFTADGVSLRYRDVGAGDAVVLIHGYTASLESMFGIGGPLASSHRIVGFDVRGFGESSKFSEPSRYGQAMVDDVVRLLDHLKIERAHLVGHSMGALIAANVAARYPARVRSATLIAGPFYADKATFTKEARPWVADLESGKGLQNFMTWLLPAMDPKVIAAFSAQAVKANDLASLIAVMRSLPELAIPGLKASGVKALVAVGTGDPLHTLSGSFAKTSMGVRLVEVEGADHISIAASPDVIRAMRDLLQLTGSGTRDQLDAA